MKIIIFTNLKGGVGKSTLCSLFATYMVEQGHPVAVMDADVQQSIVRHRERDLRAYNLPVLWETKPLTLADPSRIEEIMRKLKQLPYDVIIDCPGNIQDPRLGHIFASADIAVVPIRYDSDSLDATRLFCNVLSKQSRAEVFFIPNSVALVEERKEEIRQERDNAICQLKGFGRVVPRIKQTSVVKRYCTLDSLSYLQRNAVKYAFEPILESIKKR